MEKVDIRILKSRKMIVDAYIELLKESDDETIKINQICDKAGVSRPTFYKNYSLKQDIITVHLTDLFNDFFLMLCKKKYKMKKTMYLFFKMCEREWEFFKISIMKKFDQEIITRLKDTIEQYINHIGGLNDKINLHTYSAYTIASKTYATLIYWFENEELNCKEITELYLKTS